MTAAKRQSLLIFKAPWPKNGHWCLYKLSCPSSRRVCSKFTYALIGPESLQRLLRTGTLALGSAGIPGRQAVKVQAELLHQPGFSAPLLTRAKVVVTVHDSIARLWEGYSLLVAAGSILPVDAVYPWSGRSYYADSQHTKHDLMREIGVPEQKLRLSTAAGPEYQPTTDTSYQMIRAISYPGPTLFILAL